VDAELTGRRKCVDYARRLARKKGVALFSATPEEIYYLLWYKNTEDRNLSI
jgi:hypothetical protein